MRALANLKTILLVLAVFTLAATAGYHFLEGWSWLDSFYMVVITFSTIGYKEVHELSYAGKIFNIGVIVLGVGLAFLTIGVLTQALLEFELTRILGRRRMDREISKMNGHYIICGAGRVGASVAQELAQKPAPFVVLETDEKSLADMDKSWPYILGDATQEKTLREARIDQAAGLVAATTTDATNIYIVLTARSLNPKLRIIARASDANAEKHLRKAGADTVVSPYHFAGHRIAQSFLRPNVLDFLDIATARDGKLEMLIEEIRVGRESRLAHSTVGTSHIHHEFGIMVLAVRRPDGSTIFNPKATDRIDADDFLIVMGEPTQLNALEQVAAAPATRS
jgi:voltage-gated potassium channel